MQNLNIAFWVCTSIATLAVFYGAYLSDQYGADNLPSMPITWVLIAIMFIFGAAGLYAYYHTTFKEITQGRGGPLLLFLFLGGVIGLSALVNAIRLAIFQ